MGNDYEPGYAEGEILVCPREATLFDKDPRADFGDEFFRTVGLLKGYLLSNEQHDGTWYIFKTKPGEEKAAIDYFSKLEIKSSDNTTIKPVDWAVRRDLKLERRWKDLEELISLAESLRDNPELGKKGYNKQLDKIIDYSQKLKEP
jgi:hypothetical protein